MEIGNLWVRLGLGSDEFRKGIKESERDAQTFGKTLTGVFKTATSSVQASLRSLGQVKLKDVVQMPEFKETIGELRDLQLEYALTSSKMKNTATDTEKLEAQLEYLNSALAAHQKGMDAVRQAYNKAAAEKGKDSAEAKKLETQLKRLELAESNLKNNIHDTETALKKQTEAVNKSEGGFKSLSNQLDKFQNKTNTVSTAIKGLIAGITIRGAWNWLVSGNAEMEQYRQTLNIVLKDTQKAGEILDWATKFAAQTPFELPEIVEATTRLQAYGIEAQKVLGDIGDMAAALGKPLMQAVEAIADAQTGELERLKEFGITKQMLIDKALELGKGEIVNAQGQITNLQALNDTLIAIIQERYNGAMKAQSTTLNGMISNLKDWLGSAGRILGENIFENVKTQLDDLLVSVEELSDTGQLEEWGKRIGSIFTGLINILKWTKDHADILIPVLGGLVASFVAMKVVSTATTLMNAYRNSVIVTTIAQQGLNAALRANPIGIVITLIGLLVTAAIALYRAWVSNWGGIQTKTQAVASAIVAVANRMVISIATGFNKLKRAVFSLLEGILNAVAPVVSVIGKIAPGFEAGFQQAQAAVSNKIDDIDLQLQELGVSALKASSQLSAALSDVRATFKPEWGDLKRIDAEITQPYAEAGIDTEAIDVATESFDNLGKSAGGAGEKASKAAEDTRAAWETTADRLGIGLQILQAEYDIAAAKMGDNAGEADKLTLKHAHLTSQLELQKQVVAAVNEGYEQSVAAKGAASEEAKKLELRLMQEKKAQAELEKEIRDTNDAIEEQGKKLQELTSSVQEVASKYRNDLAKALDDYQKKVAEVNKKLADDEEKLMQDYRKSVESRAKSLMDWVGLFDAVPEKKQVTGEQLLGNLKGQVAAFENWQDLLQQIAARGVDQGLIAELQQMGPQASGEIEALLSLTDTDLQEYVLLWQQKSAMAREEATAELTSLQVETQAKIAELRAGAATELEKYRQEWQLKNEEIKENTINTLNDLIKEAGTLGGAFVSALAAAISAKMPELTGALTGIPGLSLGGDVLDQAGQAEDQQKGVLVAAKEQAAKHGAIVQTEVDAVLQSWSDAGQQLKIRQQEIKSQSLTTWQELQQGLQALWKKINDDLVAGWTNNKAFLFRTLADIDNRFTALEAAAYNWGRNLISNFIHGVQSMQGELSESLLGTAMIVENYMGFHSPTKKGPGRDADTWTPNLVQMLSSGIQDELPLLQAASEQLIDSIRAPIVNVAPSPAIAAVDGGTRTIQISVTGYSPREIGEEIYRKLKRMGV